MDLLLQSLPQSHQRSAREDSAVFWQFMGASPSNAVFGWFWIFVVGIAMKFADACAILCLFVLGCVYSMIP